MSGCDVCLYVETEVDNDFYSETVLVARKAHACCECRGVIIPGVKYQRAVGKNDGSIFTQKTCLVCAEVRTVFHCGGGFYFTMLWSEMEEQAFPRLTTASECFRELSPDAKAALMDRWIQWKGLAPSTVGRAGSDAVARDPQGDSGPMTEA